jgi:hypothetical protein
MPRQVKEYLGFPFSADNHGGQLKIAAEFRISGFWI